MVRRKEGEGRRFVEEEVVLCKLYVHSNLIVYTSERTFQVKMRA